MMERYIIGTDRAMAMMMLAMVTIDVAAEAAIAFISAKGAAKWSKWRISIAARTVFRKQESHQKTGSKAGCHGQSFFGYQNFYFWAIPISFWARIEFYNLHSK
jgi:threonine/homoserine efflux transporter RhtA